MDTVWSSDQRLLNYVKNVYVQHPVTLVLAGLGGFWSLRQVIGLWHFSRLHFFRQHRSYLDVYATSTKGSLERPWALITGASDGIGKGFAEELCDTGRWNVIIHGRNGEKLNKVKGSLLERWPGCEVEVLVLDVVVAAREPERIKQVAERFKEYDIRMIVNNVAYLPAPLMSAFNDESLDRVRCQIEGSATFGILLTRAFLPALIERKRASAILSLGSFASVIGVPYLTTYAGVKAYGMHWSEALANELAVEGHHRFAVMSVMLAEVQSNSPPGRKTGLFCPSARQFARDTLAKVGCGEVVVWGYWRHEVQGWITLCIPRVVRKALLVRCMKGMKANFDAMEAAAKKA